MHLSDPQVIDDLRNARRLARESQCAASVALPRAAIRRIDASDIGDTLLLYDELLRRADSEDLMALDVRAELAAIGKSDE